MAKVVNPQTVSDNLSWKMLSRTEQKYVQKNFGRLWEVMAAGNLIPPKSFQARTVNFEYLPKDKKELSEFTGWLEYILESPTTFNKSTLKLSDIEEIKSLDPSTLYYRSNKFTLSEGKIYPSEAAWKENKPLQDKSQIFPIINNDLFWESIDNYQIFQK